MKIRYKNRFDKQRRDIIKAITAAGISKGLLGASSLVGGMMIGRVAEAAGVASKSCLVFQGGGCHPNKWFPSGGTLPEMTKPFQPYYSHLNFLKSASLSQAGHGVMFHRFNDGSFNDDSFDVNMGNTIGSNYPVSVLNVGTKGLAPGEPGYDIKSLSRRKQGEIATIVSPALALQTLFAGGGGGGGGGSTGGGSAAGLPFRASIVDAHLAAMKALSSKLGQHEKIKLESHLDAINELDKTINRNGGGTTTTPPPAAQSCSQPSGSASGFDATVKLLTDIIVLGLDCNLTASVSLALGDDTHEFPLDKLRRNSHESHHNQGNEPQKYVEDITYFSGLTANLFGKLIGKGLLDSTIVTVVSDMGDADQHANSNVPMIVAGPGIQGGRAMDVGGKTQADLFQSVGRLLGADESQYGASYRNWNKSGISGL